MDTNNAYDDGSTDQSQQLVSTTFLDKNTRIPKYCNGALFNKLSNGSVIVTFVLRELSQTSPQNAPVEENLVIEKLLIDPDHVKKLAKVFNELAQ